MSKKLFILALDGVPYSTLKLIIADGVMPNLGALVSDENFRPMHSVYPTVSSTAWATFMTGMNPGRHGIYGFIERDPGTMEVYIPNAAHLHGQTLWEYLSHLGKKVFVMNVPCTYPPRKVNGILISGFLGTDITRMTYPPSVGPDLQRREYRIDADTWRAREDLEGFVRELHQVYDKRIAVMQEYYLQSERDFCMLHVMETDRLHHFLWEHRESGHPRWAAVFIDLYRKIDRLIGWILDNLKPDMELMLLSDHGFCTLKKEVFINRWLFDQGYLRFQNGKTPDDLRTIHPQSRAYSLIPGRIYINLRGRESIGSVDPGNAYERLRAELAENLADLRDPDTGDKMIEAALTREALYLTDIGSPGVKSRIQEDTSVSTPPANRLLPPADCFSLAPDLQIIPRDGYDFKGNLWRERLTEKGPVVGTHTCRDAFVCIPGSVLSGRPISLIDMMPTILDLMGVEFPACLEGRSAVDKDER